MFQHHPDNLNIIRVDGQLAYCASPSEFAADLTALALPAYEGLSAPYVERRYFGPERHFLLTAENQEAGPDSWSFGDAVLARASDLAALYDARRGAVAPVEPVGSEAKLFKTDLYASMTDEELQTLSDFLSTGATLRQRLRFQDSIELNRDDAELYMMGEILFGTARITQLLGLTP